MIFYFSGTGNSKYVAEKIALKTNDETVDICNCTNYDFTKISDDKIGFIFPTYYYSIPTVVQDFLSKCKLNFSNKYVYLVLTCGGDIGRSYNVFEKYLQSKLSAVYSVKMPDNYILLYEPSDEKTQYQVIKNADKKICTISDKINEKYVGKFDLDENVFGGVVTFVVSPIYNLSRKTKKFYATENCNLCGLCAKNCPENAIKIIADKPVWIKEKCSHCTKCINYCPQKAIEYGSKTKKRRRYNIDNIISNS